VFCLWCGDRRTGWIIFTSCIQHFRAEKRSDISGVRQKARDLTLVNLTWRSPSLISLLSGSNSFRRRRYQAVHIRQCYDLLVEWHIADCHVRLGLRNNYYWNNFFTLTKLLQTSYYLLSQRKNLKRKNLFIETKIKAGHIKNEDSFFDLVKKTLSVLSFESYECRRVLGRLSDTAGQTSDDLYCTVSLMR